MILYFSYVIAIALVGWLFRLLHAKNVDKIVLARVRRKRVAHEGKKHVLFCLADHFEPLWQNVGPDRAVERVRTWMLGYPRAVDRFRDKSGRPPQHVFFYPQEEYLPECVDMLAVLRNTGYGDVEIHLHHDHDTSEAFREKLLTFKDTLRNTHGLLHGDPTSGGIEYGFIHGMWALDDSAGRGRWCGVRDEISILRETGCYADFTYPSAPHVTQPPVINRIYYATDDRAKPKSHHRGIDASVRSAPQGDLLLINGPLAINWHSRRGGIVPRIENGSVGAHNPPNRDRVDLWIRVGVGVVGWPNWIFVKVYTHGCQDRTCQLLLGGGMDSMYGTLLENYNDGERYVLHFVTAREMYLCVKALESGDEEWIERIEEQFEYGKPREHKRDCPNVPRGY